MCFRTDPAIRLCKQVHGRFEGLLHQTSDHRGEVRLQGQVQREHLQAGKRVEEVFDRACDPEGGRGGVHTSWAQWNGFRCGGLLVDVMF